MTKVTLQLKDKTGLLSPGVDVQINWTSGLKEFPGSPGPGRILEGQTMDQALGGIDYLPTRIAQYKSDTGNNNSKPTSFHHYQPPYADGSAATNAANKLAAIDKATALGLFSLLDIKESTHVVVGKTVNHTFDDVANGSSDDYFDAIIAGAKQRRIFLAMAYHDEPAGDGLGGYTEYGGAIQRLQSRIIRANAQDIVSCGAMLGMGQYAEYGGSNPDPDKWIAAVAPFSNFLGDHRYNQSNDLTDPWGTPESLFEKFFKLQDTVTDSLGLQRMVRIHGEWSAHAKPNDPNWFGGFVNGFYALKLKYNVRASMIFDSNTSSPNGGWRLDDATRRKAFAQTLVLPTSGYAH